MQAGYLLNVIADVKRKRKRKRKRKKSANTRTMAPAGYYVDVV